MFKFKYLDLNIQIMDDVMTQLRQNQEERTRLILSINKTSILINEQSIELNKMSVQLNTLLCEELKLKNHLNDIELINTILLDDDLENLLNS